MNVTVFFRGAHEHSEGVYWKKNCGTGYCNAEWIVVKVRRESESSSPTPVARAIIGDFQTLPFRDCRLLQFVGHKLRSRSAWLTFEQRQFRYIMST